MGSFFSAIGGVLTRPYDTVGNAVNRRDWRTGVAIPLVAIVLVALVAIWLPGASNSGIVTDVLAAIVLFAATFVAAAGVVYWSCRAVGAMPDWKAIIAAWGLTYVPTGGWFLTMLIVHVIRPAAAAPLLPLDSRGLATYQVIFAVISLAFFLWKALLYYFALRLGGGLSFPQIVKASLILAPVAIAYWVAGLTLGLLKVPFI